MLNIFSPLNVLCFIQIFYRLDVQSIQCPGATDARQTEESLAALGIDLVIYSLLRSSASC